jgi:tetratricopeptide (TPR) repeat protein
MRMKKYAVLLMAAGLLFTGCVSTKPLYSRQEVSLYSKAFHLYSTARYIESESALTELISINGKNTYAYLLRSMVRRFLEKPDLAIGDLLIAKTLEPDNAAVYYNLGCIYDAMSEYDPAIECYSKTIQLDPRFADAYLNRANAYMKMNKSSAALADYKVFLTMSDDQKEQILSLITLLEGD